MHSQDIAADGELLQLYQRIEHAVAADPRLADSAVLHAEPP